MISKEWIFKKPQDEIFKCFIRATFANSAIKLTPLEVEILDITKKFQTGYNANRIARITGAPVQSLNNYKAKLVKKGLLVKATDKKYYVNPKFNISNLDNEMTLTLKFVPEDGKS